MKDFYFIFYPIGPLYIKTLTVTFKYLPKEANVIVMTSTPELLKDIKVDFNLIVLDIDDIVDDFSKQYEPVIKETNDDLYIQKLRENIDNNIRFPYGKHRYIIPWLLERDITKFVILDSDCLINYNNELEPILNHFEEKYGDTNLLFGPPMAWTYNVDMAYESFKDIFNKYNIDLNIFPSLNNKITVFDGWMRGFYFKDKELLKLYFNLWDEILKKAYELDYISLYDMSNRVAHDEWVTGLLNEIMTKQFNAELKDVVYDVDSKTDKHGKRLCKHIYHPENDYWELHHQTLYVGRYNLEIGESRKDFFQKNKEKLITFYADQNSIEEQKIKEIIYDYEYLNS
jgi:hypothetical protein